MADLPPVSPLPVAAEPVSWRLFRSVLLGLFQALGLIVITTLLTSVELTGLTSAISVIAVLALLNVSVWPVVLRVAAPLIMLTVGLFTFVLNAVFIVVAADIVDGFVVRSLWSAFLVALWLAAVNVGVGGLLEIDDFVWRRVAVRRIVKRRDPPNATDVPGILFIQIDGLGHDVLDAAMRSGDAPTLARLVDGGSHQFVAWECDLSSQTGAMQAGILLGDNRNMPAFRWFEKGPNRVFVSNRPRDASEIERRQSTGSGLLADGGASRMNVFSGDASEAMFTFSTVLSRPMLRTRFVYAIATPFALLRLVVLSAVDIGREYRDARRSRRDRHQPRMTRGGVYPLLRAATGVVLADITYSMLIADIERGVPAAYADLVGYDEIAHHSGPGAPESSAALKRIDHELNRLLSVIGGAPRPYYVVILSDHGQTQGWTFEQRYGTTLDGLVRQLAGGVAVAAPELADESWSNINCLLTDAAADDSTIGRVVARATRDRSADGEVELGPLTDRAVVGDDEIVVLASGNLGLLSFTRIDGRASRQQIDGMYPFLLDGLCRHEGVGFVVVRDDVEGDVVLGPSGVRYLDQDRVDGVDPLEPFGTNAARHLRRTSAFENCPDVLVNSFYDPESETGAAFEALVGFHGGLGGPQCHPFILAPSALEQPTAPLVGAESVHALFKTWVGDISRSTHPGSG